MKPAHQTQSNSSDILTVVGAVFILSTCAFLDIYLSFVVTSLPQGTALPISSVNYSSDGLSGHQPCFTPFCDLNIKMLLLDPPNFYIHCPLSSLLVSKLDLVSNYQFITANMISYSHVLVALIAGRLISRDSLFDRRLGVLLFEARNFLDALDGSVARSRRNNQDNNIYGAQELEEISSISSYTANYNVNGLSFLHPKERPSSSNAGFWIDGICDALGCIFLYLGCITYLRKHPTKSLISYSPLPLVVLTRNKLSFVDSTNCHLKIVNGEKGHSKRCILRQIMRSIVHQSGLSAILFGFQTLLSSVAWNRYIASYSKIIEATPYDVQSLRSTKSGFLRSPTMWLIIFLWRYVNPHAWVEILLIAIFFDKMGELLQFLRYTGFGIIVFAIFITEMNLYKTRNAIRDLIM
jgi:hypothetical protein